MRCTGIMRARYNGSFRRSPAIEVTLSLALLLAGLLITLVASSCAMGGSAKVHSPSAAFGAEPTVTEVEVSRGEATSLRLDGDEHAAISEAAAMTKQELVVEGRVTAEVDDVATVAKTLRDKIEAGGGRVVSETGMGGATSWRVSLKVRLAPGGVDELVSWLDAQGEILSKQIQAQDVSKELFDQELALKNLEQTMERMQAILQRPDLDIESVLKIEKEMTRVRGEIESIKGSRRYLKDRVAFATLDIELERKEGAIRGDRSKFAPGFRFSMLTLLDAGGRTRTRFGAGAVLHMPIPRMHYELDVFESVDGDKRGILATVGGAVYSDYLGHGRRHFLNPYLGIRAGYGRLEGSNFVLAADAGLEIFKTEMVLVDVNLRATSFFGKGGADLALVSGAAVSVSF